MSVKNPGAIVPDAATLTQPRPGLFVVDGAYVGTYSFFEESETDADAPQDGKRSTASVRHGRRSARAKRKK